MLRDANDYAHAEFGTEADTASNITPEYGRDDVTIEDRARGIVQRLTMPEIRQIWPRAYREAITVVAQVLEADGI